MKCPAGEAGRHHRERPEANGIESSTSLNGEAVEGKIALQAALDAKPVSRVQTVVIGLVSIEFSVFVPYSTPPIQVSVAAKDGPVAAAE